MAIILSLLVSGLFLFNVLYSSSAFNYIPYLIHETISPGGKEESTFITIFNICFSILLFLIFYKIFSHILSKRR